MEVSGSKYYVRVYNVSPAPDDPKGLYRDSVDKVAEVEFLDTVDPSAGVMDSDSFAVSATQSIGPYLQVTVELEAGGTGGENTITLGIELVGRDA